MRKAMLNPRLARRISSRRIMTGASRVLTSAARLPIASSSGVTRDIRAKMPFARFSGDAAATVEVAEGGMEVSVNYKGQLDDGSVFDSSEGKPPLTFILGSGMMIPGFDQGVRGMQVGDKRDITIEPKDAYGEIDPKNCFEVDAKLLPEGCEPGTRLQMTDGNQVFIKELGDEKAILDRNHPLAGKKLQFHVELVALKPAPEKLSELKVELVSPGDGKTFPEKGDKLTMHYTGTLLYPPSGAKFDSSRDRGEPFSFTIGVGQVIQGWDEGVMKMSLGERANLHIPAAKGYGDVGAGAAIPPNADLHFDVELLKIDRSS